MVYRISALLAAATVLAATTVANASIVSANLGDDGDGAISCQSYGLTQIGTAAYSLDVDGIQYRTPGDVLGNIVSDTATDPSLTLNHAIDNDTGFLWTDYHVKVTMDKPFTLSGASVSIPGGWTSTITAPTQVGSSWIGYVDYYAGTYVPNGGTLDFTYTATFTGSAAFCETLTPTSVPAPAALPAGLALLAGLGLGAKRLRRRA